MALAAIRVWILEKFGECKKGEPVSPHDITKTSFVSILPPRNFGGDFACAGASPGQEER